MATFGKVVLYRFAYFEHLYIQLFIRPCYQRSIPDIAGILGNSLTLLLQYGARILLALHVCRC